MIYKQRRYLRSVYTWLDIAKSVVTSKHFKVLEHFIKCGNKTEAYRQHYDCSSYTNYNERFEAQRVFRRLDVKLSQAAYALYLKNEPLPNRDNITTNRLMDIEKLTSLLLG
jgi:hypothetical protein